MNLQRKITDVRSSIVAIGFNSNPQQINILGSGFSISDDGKIVTAAHLLNNLTKEQVDGLKASIMVEQKGDLERYQWVPIKLLNKHDKNDLAVFQLSDEYKQSLLKKMLL